MQEVRITRRAVLALGVTLAGFCAGCAVLPTGGAGSTEQADDAPQATPIAKQAPEGVHLRDNDALYTVYDDTGVVTMYLTVTRGPEAENTDHTWAEINHYSAYDYDYMQVARYQVAGLLQAGDENGPALGEVGFGETAPNVTVQIRGQTSSRNAQKNYKIKLKKNKGSWRGQRTIALNKHEGDGLRFRNKLAYDLIREIPQMVGLRTQFVHLYVKDQTEQPAAAFVDYGLYTQVEQLNKAALKAHGLDENGHLYKVNFFEFRRYEDVLRLASDPAYDETAFEQYLEIKGDRDHTKLLAMLDTLNDEMNPMEELLGTTFDAENIAYWMAFQLLTGNTDTQSRNMYLYSPLNRETWYILDWDNDSMLTRTERALHGFQDGLSWEQGVSNYWGNVLFRRCLQTAAFREELDKAVEEVFRVLSAERIASMSAHYRSVVEPYLWQLPDVTHAPLTKAQYDTVVNSLHAEIAENHTLYRESLKKPMPFYIGLPEVQNGQLHLQWDASFDFAAEDLTYSAALARDYTFAKPFWQQEGLVLPEATVYLLPAGQYFLRVQVRNASGYTQDAFDYYVTEQGKYYGIKSFFVAADGSITEDTYEE